MERVLGLVDGSQPGPHLVVVAGLHGNEPAGVLAARRVLDRLRAGHLHLKGRFVAVSGNRGALAEGVRYLDRDLNRRWSPADFARLRSAEPRPDCREDREQTELERTLDGLLAHGRDLGRPVVLLDVHTTSGDGAPFAAFTDTPENRRLALDLPIPLILGLAEILEGPMLHHYAVLGHPCIVVEGGRHDRDTSVDNLEAAMWILMVALGCLDRTEVPGFDVLREGLAGAARGLPRAVEIFHRQPVTPEDGFVMEPGFRNFQRVHAQQRLARDRHGIIHASRDSHLLMPLYQGLGEDGFFLAHDVDVNDLHAARRHPVTGRISPTER